MEPFEEPIEHMFAVAKILGRLSVEGHITPDELAMLQAELMRPTPQPFHVISSPNYTAPKPEIPSVWGGTGSIWNGSGTVTLRADGSIGVATNPESGGITSYLVLK